MEASALTAAGHRGLLARRSPLLRLQSDEKLVAMIRDGHDHAFEVLFDRYQSRLLSFCRHMVGSSQDAEDLLQEAFVAAHSAMLADERPITARPWLYRIARNRCLNFLRKPVADGQDSMDVHPHANGTTTFERVQRREELRTIVADVQELPETQRSALVLRERSGSFRISHRPYPDLLARPHLRGPSDAPRHAPRQVVARRTTQRLQHSRGGLDGDCARPVLS